MTGGDTTTDGADTDGPNVETWLCSELAHENCQTRSGSGILADDDHCWSVSETTSRCVKAATKADAVASCECICSVDDATYSDACDSPGVCEVALLPWESR